MPFHFKKAEPPDRAVRRVCRERLGMARKCLRRGGHGSSVHGARKEIKKVRAVLRLIRAETSPDDYCKVMKALRRAANNLAAVRDARVGLQAFKQLASRSSSRLAAVEQALRSHAGRETRRFAGSDSRAAARQSLSKACRRLRKIQFRTAGWAAMGPGLRASFRRGQADLMRVQREATPENLHAWRKRVKDLSYQLRLFCPAWPPATRALMGRMESLGELLGEYNDLVRLQELAGGLCADAADEIAALNRLRRVRQKILCAAALRLGAQVYSKPPAAFGRRLAQDWNAWRK